MVERMSGQKICCLISLDDWNKAPLLTSIAKEEGVSYCQIRIPLRAEIIDFSKFKMENIKVIFSFDPLELKDLDFSLEETNNLIIGKINSLITVRPFAIELDSKIQGITRRELIEIAKKTDTKLIFSKYFNDKVKQKELERFLKEIDKEYGYIKISAETQDCYDAMELLEIGKRLKKDFIINPRTKKCKLAQIIAPFLGSTFTYAYLGKKSEEAMISIGYMRKALEAMTNIL